MSGFSQLHFYLCTRPSEMAHDDHTFSHLTTGQPLSAKIMKLPSVF